ncbi:MAG: hypothetical protein HYY18_20135 [Planctomycetes bacterium]|nr:hypothetical protein [Planctomycetota bacterium]
MPCPDPETLARLAEGTLAGAEFDAAQAHLAECEACREVLLVVIPEEKGTSRRIPLPRREFPRGLATAAAVLVAAGAFALRTALPEKKSTAAPERLAQEFKPQSSPLPEPEPPKPGPDVEPEPPPDVPEPPKPEPESEPPKPEPPRPEPPRPEPPRPEPPKPEPTRALAAVRFLDVTGRLLLGKTAVSDGRTTDQLLTAPNGASFRVDGHLVAFGKGASAKIARDGETYVLDVEKGEVYVEPQGAAWRVRGAEMALDFGAVVTPTTVQRLRDLPSTPAANLRARFQPLFPKQTTRFFEDFASRAGGFERAVAQDGSILGARVELPKAAPYTKNLAVRCRYRTAARTLQVGLHVRGRLEPWAAMADARAGGWQELTVHGSDFSAGPPGGEGPADGDDVLELSFAINTAEPGSGDASLEIDDVRLIEEEKR